MIWSDLSYESRIAAKELFKSKRFRSSVSRSYYSLYSEVTGRLVNNGVSFQSKRANPAHSKLPRLVLGNLCMNNKADKRAVRSVIGRLYTQRLQADYYPGSTIDEEAARRALGDLHRAIKILEKY